MAVSFLTAAQRDRYGRYPDMVTPDDLARCFHLSDEDHAQIMSCRGHHNRLGFALQLTTVRYLGTFLDDPVAVPSPVLQSLSHQLAIQTLDGLQSYRKGEQREEHVTKIRKRYGYGDITEPRVGLRMTRWLYGVCRTGTERLGSLFDRATAWLLAHKILLPGVTTLERFVVSVRARVEAHLCRLLTRGITVQQRDQLQRLLLVPEGARVSLLDQIRSGPTRISGPAIRAAIDRLNAVRALGITVPMKAHIPSSRIASLARFANRAKAQAISRMPAARRLATLVAFVHCLEATAQDEVLEVLEILLHDLFGKAIMADQKARLRSLKDLDESAAALAEACRLLLDPELPDEYLRKKVFAKIPRASLENARERVSALIRPPDDVYYQELSEHYRSVKGYLPHVLTHISFEAAPAGRPLLAACDWLRDQQDRNKTDSDAPREVIDKAWQRYVVQKDGRVDYSGLHLLRARPIADCHSPARRVYQPELALRRSASQSAIRCGVGSDTPDRLPHARTAARSAAVPRQPVGRVGQNLSRGRATAAGQSGRSIRKGQRQGRTDPDAFGCDGRGTVADPAAQGRGRTITARGVGRARTGGSLADRLHINTQGRHSFSMPEAVVKGELRPLRNPVDDPD